MKMAHMTLMETAIIWSPTLIATRLEFKTKASLLSSLASSSTWEFNLLFIDYYYYSLSTDFPRKHLFRFICQIQFHRNDMIQRTSSVLSMNQSKCNLLALALYRVVNWFQNWFHPNDPIDQINVSCIWSIRNCFAICAAHCIRDWVNKRHTNVMLFTLHLSHIWCLMSKMFFSI